MTTIKMDVEVMNDCISNLKESIENYKESVIHANLKINDLQTELEGKSYEALTDKVNNKIEDHKKLIAHCEVLIAEMNNYAIDMAQTETSISFY